MDILDNALLLYLMFPVVSIGLAIFILHKKVKRILIGFCISIIWVAFFAAEISSTLVPHTELLTLTALGTHSELSEGDHVLVTGMMINETYVPINDVVEGKWISYEGDPNTHALHYGWFPGDDRQDETITQSITFRIPVGSTCQLLFNSYPWSGMVEIKTENWSQVVDTYGQNVETAVSIPNIFSWSTIITYEALPHYAIIFILIVITMFCIILLVTEKRNLEKISKYKFLFSQLVNRDFVLKYKRTVLGMLWSMLSPFFNLIIMWLVFSKLLGGNIDHYAVYLFTGQIIFSYFSESTNLGMTALLDNAPIFTKVNVPKYMFIFSKSVSSLINFLINAFILFVFAICDGVPVTENWLMLICPIVLLVIFNIGLSLILSACFVFFRDMQYLWGIASQLLMWLSAIFYSIDSFPQFSRNLFLLNPMYLFIRYFRKIILENTIPSIWFHLLMTGYALTAIIIGAIIYKKKNHEFLYYV